MENDSTTKFSGTRKHYDGADDPALLIVKGASVSKEDTGEYVKNLASVICLVYQKYNVVRLRGIGKAANGNALSAIAIAIPEMERRGIKLVAIPSYKSVSFDDGEDRTAMVCEIIGIPIATYNAEIEKSKVLIAKHKEEVAEKNKGA